MKILRNLLLSMAAVLCSFVHGSYFKEGKIDLRAVDEALEAGKLEVRIHGAAASSSMYVFSLRDPDNFFTYQLFSMIPHEDVAQKISDLLRHDKVKLRGRLLENASSQPHALVTGIDIVESAEGTGSHFEPPALTLAPEGKAHFLVHAVEAEKGILVVEREQNILPVFVREKALLRELFRGDRIELSYRQRRHPGSPMHLSPMGENAIRVVDSVVVGHGEPIERIGNLVLFPKSQQVAFDVYAIEEVSAHSLNRYFTVLNFEDAELFTRIREKFETLWKNSSIEAVDARNKWVKPGLRVKVRGLKNVVSTSQANPQIVVDDLSNISLDE